VDNEIIETEASEPIEYDGQIEGGEETVVEEAPVEYFPVDDYGDKYVKVVVDGEELDVPLKEAVSGYQRQADYTRKTQQLAEERRQVQFAQAIQQALDNDPAATIELLQSHYGVNFNQTLEEDEYLDPIEQQYRHLDERIRSFEEQQAYVELERTIDGLQQKYGEEFDANEVVSTALATGSSDLEAIHKQLAYDRLWQKQVVSQKIQQEQQQKQSQVTQAKREAGVISGASSARSATPDSQPINSLRDAFAAAKQQLGIS
jgi:predicted metal-dependent hydrolase